jgi:PilZ domain
MSRHRDPNSDRRREARVNGAVVRARLRPGYRLVIVDLSAYGALVEAARPLRPGSHVDLHLESDTRRRAITARVLRCTVAAIDSQSGVTYRAALSFNDTCDWVREASTQDGYDLPECTNEATGLATAIEARLPMAAVGGPK